MQDAGPGLAELSGCRTLLRELSIRGEAAGPGVMAAVAGSLPELDESILMLDPPVCVMSLFGGFGGCSRTLTSTSADSTGKAWAPHW